MVWWPIIWLNLQFRWSLAIFFCFLNWLILGFVLAIRGFGLLKVIRIPFGLNRSCLFFLYVILVLAGWSFFTCKSLRVVSLLVVHSNIRKEYSRPSLHSQILKECYFDIFLLSNSVFSKMISRFFSVYILLSAWSTSSDNRTFATLNPKLSIWKPLV